MFMHPCLCIYAYVLSRTLFFSPNSYISYSSSDVFLTFLEKFGVLNNAI